MLNYTNPIGVKFVYINGGTFEMGSDKLDYHLRPVGISGFWMSENLITNKQFEKFIKHARNKYSWEDDQPVTGVSFSQAQEFAMLCQKKFGKYYRLPSDSEWEFAARGGLAGKLFPWGDTDDIDSGMAAVGLLHTVKVGSFAPNKYGLYDMCGNAQEYVLDAYSYDGVENAVVKFSTLGTVVNPLYIQTSEDKTDEYAATRGGSFGGWDHYVFLQSGVPTNGESEDFYDCGLRLVMTDQPTKFKKIYIKPESIAVGKT